MTNTTIRDLVIIAIASDDELFETLVLKGGTAIALLERGKKNSLSRASFDLDYSMSNEFGDKLDEYKNRIHQTLEKTFHEQKLVLIDYGFTLRPSLAPDATKDFWGGYNIQFKLVPTAMYEKHRDNLSELRKYALKILPNQSPRVEIEISKFEFVGKKIAVEVEGYHIFIYSPEMIVFEKLRAICQQHPQYTEIIPSHSPRARARDFYDIHLISSTYNIDIEDSESIQILMSVFAAKKVPLEFIKLIKENSGIHRNNWQSVKDTVSAQEDIQDFDFYMDYVINKFATLTYP